MKYSESQLVPVFSAELPLPPQNVKDGTWSQRGKKLLRLPPCSIARAQHPSCVLCSFHCFQFNLSFSHKLKIIGHRVYLLLFNRGMSKQEFQEKLISTTISVFCDIKEGHLAS